MSEAPPSTGWPDPVAEETVVSTLLVPLAQARLELQLGDVGSADSKAFGVLALDAGAVGLVLATHDSINRLWPILLVVFLAAAGVLIVSIWPRKFQMGVVLDEFYTEMSEASPLEASRQMLSELNSCKVENDKPLDQKVLQFKCGLALFVLALLGVIPIALAHP
jgi:hypothetical protein